MLRTRSAIIPMLYRPAPAARARPPTPTLATRPLTSTTTPAMSGQEAAKDFIQFVNDSPTRASPPPTPP